GADPPLPDLHEARPISELRILDRHVFERASRSADVASLEQHDVRRAATLFAAPVHGTLHVLVREPSTRGQRIRRALWAWASNRGLRDLRLGGGAALGVNAARIADRPVRVDGRLQPPGRLQRALRFALAYTRELARWVGDLLALASRAGEARRFDYTLRLGAPSAGDPRDFPALFDAAPDGRPPAEIRAHKRLAYVPGGNPFRQLAEATIDAFPLPFVDRQVPRLVLDTAWLARRRLPLLRIVRMESLPDAYADLGALAATLARMLVGLHLWSFRKPEPPSPQVPRRLPGALPHPDRPEIALAPEVTVLTVDAGLREPDEAPAGGPGPTRVAVRLSRYRASGATVGPPIVTFHGYSASGTTFAHPALRPSLAAWFAARGRDVWVVDLRTSCGLPESALRPWRFEDVAWNDIPAALAHVRRVTGAEQLDVVAHCMGAVMFAMAVLRPDAHAGPWAAELTALPGWLRRVVLSQGGPVLTFSPANRLRAYVMSRKRMLLGSGAWQTRAATPPTPADDLLDRLLAALPYRDAQDFRREFPLFAPASATTFVRTRHRLDVLFGETFPLGPISDEVLASIDDLFGPIDLDTVAQTIRFATDHRAASAVGPARPAQEFRTDPAWLEKRWTFETRHVVGARNGLLDPATVTLANHTFRGRRYTAEVLEGFGHQDVLIGRDAERFLADHVAPFLDPHAACAVPPPPPDDRPRVRAPRAVEVLRHDERETRLAIHTAPDAGEPDAVVVVGPWTVANVEAVRAGRCNDWPGALRWGQPAGSLQAGHWLLAPGPQGCHAVFQVTGRGTPPVDDDASFEQDVAAAVVAAIRSAVEGWTPPLIDLRAAPVDPARTLELYAFSCQYPAALVEGPVAYASMRRLAHVLNTAAEQPGVARWVVSMGDLVYVDATAGLFEPSSLSDYFDGPWERLKQVPEVRSMLSGAGANFAAIADDHEIDDNWEPMRTVPKPEAPLAAPPPNTVKYERGRDAFQRHVGAAARRGDGGRGPVLPVTGDGSIFLADTRLTRKARSLSELASAHLLDESLRQTLSTWLLDQAHHHPDRPKIVVCPSLLLPRRLTGAFDGPASALRSDAWDGYPASMAWLFDLVATHGIRHLVVVSGDEHLSMVASAEVSVDGGPPLRIHSVHCSPMHAPYPFANARAEEFATDETFELERPAGGRLTCRMLGTTFARAREGFGRITVRHDGERWRVEVLFMDGWNYDEAEPHAPPGSRAGRRAAARRARDHLVELAL
ncbi:MAG: alkaline phosphatase D family protein, partial [Burkholderiaceae bacterium]